MGFESLVMRTSEFRGQMDRQKQSQEKKDPAWARVVLRDIFGGFAAPGKGGSEPFFRAARRFRAW